MREIKFRAWGHFGSDTTDIMVMDWQSNVLTDYVGFDGSGYFELMQFTGLLDKNGREIYELMELDNKWKVDWLNGKYILRDISNGDILELNYENKYEITREYTKV